MGDPKEADDPCDEVPGADVAWGQRILNMGFALPPFFVSDVDIFDGTIPRTDYIRARR